jgi:hypothetical protein
MNKKLQTETLTRHVRGGSTLTREFVRIAIFVIERNAEKRVQKRAAN